MTMHSHQIPKEVKGKSILNFLDKDNESDYCALYGYWGGGINITDGKYTYFHYPENFNQYDRSRYQYTLMPTNMRQFFSNEELQTATMHKPFNFTKNIPVMKVNKILKKTDQHVTLTDTKSALYNLKEDPGQLVQIHDNHLLSRYKDIMIKEIKLYDPPKELLKNYFNQE